MEEPKVSWKNNFKLLAISLFLISLGSSLLYLGLTQKPNNQPTQNPEVTVDATSNTQQTFLVTRVVDGDTIEIEGGQKVRLIGIDTPETVDPRRGVQCFGKKASDELKKLIEGKRVILETDISETDKYSRLLRYVYLPQSQGDIFINEYLVLEGFAKSSSFPPDIKYQEQLRQAEIEAKTAGRGLWKECD